jgi:hypothetical protein
MKEKHTGPDRVEEDLGVVRDAFGLPTDERAAHLPNTIGQAFEEAESISAERNAEIAAKEAKAKAAEEAAGKVREEQQLNPTREEIKAEVKDPEKQRREYPQSGSVAEKKLKEAEEKERQDSAKKAADVRAKLEADTSGDAKPEVVVKEKSVHQSKKHTATKAEKDEKKNEKSETEEDPLKKALEANPGAATVTLAEKHKQGKDGKPLVINDALTVWKKPITEHERQNGPITIFSKSNPVEETWTDTRPGQQVRNTRPVKSAKKVSKPSADTQKSADPTLQSEHRIILPGGKQVDLKTEEVIKEGAEKPKDAPAVSEWEHTPEGIAAIRSAWAKEKADAKAQGRPFRSKEEVASQAKADDLSARMKQNYEAWHKAKNEESKKQNPEAEKSKVEKPESASDFDVWKNTPEGIAALKALEDRKAEGAKKEQLKPEAKKPEPATKPVRPTPIPPEITSSAAAIGPNTPPSQAAMEHAAAAMKGKEFGEKSTLSKVASWFGKPFRKTGEWLRSIGERRDFNSATKELGKSMQHEDSKVDKYAIRFAAEKASFDMAKAKVVTIENAIKAIDKQRTDNPNILITPKIAAKMEKAKRELQGQLLDAQADQESALRMVQLREAQTINHENKRTEIAKHYAELVDNRLCPQVEKRKELDFRRNEYKKEIDTWSKKIDGYKKSIAELEDGARNNPFLKPIFKTQIKEAKKMLASSQYELSIRTGTLQHIDGELTSVRDTLQKWDNRKAEYARIASQKIEKHNGHYIAAGEKKAGEIGYSDPVPPGRTAAAEAVDGINAEARAGAIENAPNAFSYKEWVDTWNSLYGTRLRLDPSILIEADKEKNKEAAESFGYQSLKDEQFAGIVKLFLGRKEIKAAVGDKVKENEINTLAKRVLATMRDNAVEKSMAGEATS